ncbi:DUF6384 family protein [Orbus sturtevantii]|uniref:DUF6384 family protein n=1 Tax=Orbus sturtevantii TaxID=3074109 RepID=UPI00370DD34A
MQEIKLSDQLGAMAIIDELYQKQQLLLEHLDRDKLRHNLAEKIIDYYQTKGFVVDNKIIDDGINLWFDNRLRFNAPKRSKLQNILIFCYVIRNSWLPVIGFLLFVLLMVDFVSFTNMTQLEKNINLAYNNILTSKQSLVDLNYELKSLNEQDIMYAQTSVKKLRISISELLNQEIVPPIIKPIIEDSLTAGEVEKIFNELKKIDFFAKDKLSAIASQISQLRALTENDHKLVQLINNPKFIQASKHYPILQIAVDSAIDELNRGVVGTDFNYIERLYDSVDKVKMLEGKMQADMAQLKSLNVPPADLMQLTALQTALKTDLKALRFDNVDDYNNMIAYYIKLAQTPLVLTIVDEVGYKSGVERTYNSNGKSWFLIVRPMSLFGHSESLWVKSIETGKTKRVDMFGQQVSRDLFDQVKADKVQDGHIDNVQLCNKPIGRLEFDCPISVKAGRILEW